MDNSARADGFIAGQHDAKTVDRTGERIPEIEILLDGVEEVRLLPIAELPMVRLIAGVNADICHRRGIMTKKTAGLRMRIDVGGSGTVRRTPDPDAPLRADDVLHEGGGFTPFWIDCQFFSSTSQMFRYCTRLP